MQCFYDLITRMGNVYVMAMYTYDEAFSIFSIICLRYRITIARHNADSVAVAESV